MRLAEDLTLLLKLIVIKLLKISFKWDDGKDNLNVNIQTHILVLISANNQYGTNIRAIPTDLTALISEFPLFIWIILTYINTFQTKLLKHFQ